jgi:hypothetical protein
VPFDKLVLRVHALKRMFQREVTEHEVRAVLSSGTVIEAYPDDTPYPSRLALGWSGNRPLHVVATDNTDDRETIVVTVYEPEPSQWEPDFTRRKT